MTKTTVAILPNLTKDFSDPWAQSQIVVVKEVVEHLDRTEITIEGSWQQGFVGSQIYVGV